MIYLAGQQKSFTLPVVITAACLLAASLAPRAHADGQGSYSVITTDGAWEIGSGTDSQGNQFCRAEDDATNGNSGLGIYIYPLGNDPSFEIHVFKSSWNIPANTDIPTKFAFDDGTTWNSTGSVSDSDSSVIDYIVDFSNFQDFMNDFAQSQSLNIEFTDGNEPNWSADLTDTQAAKDDFVTCANNMLNNSNSNGGSNATQPFSNTQPVTPPTQNKTL